MATLAVVIATGAVLAGAAPASATVTCAYDGTLKNLAVTLDGPGDGASIEVAGDTIVVKYGPGVPATCGLTAPTVTNTNEVFVSATSATDNTVIFTDPAALSPGFSDEPGDNEIEVSVDLGPDMFSSDHLRLNTGVGGGDVRWGALGINTNAGPAESVPDEDIIVVNAERFDAIGGTGADTFGAQGGAGTGEPFPGNIDFDGDAGADSLTGGNHLDGLTGGEGADVLSGQGGDDFLAGGPGDDVMTGDDGSDTATYMNTSAGVTVDLGHAGPQETGAAGRDSLSGIERVEGTPFADTLTGDNVPNELFGRQGNDTLNLRDGGPDTGDCGDDTDAVEADLEGTDTLIACESVVFAAPPGPVLPDTTAPAFIGRVRAVPAKFAVKRRGTGTSFRYALTEAATVTFTIQRITRGRLVRGRCRRQSASNRSHRRCSRFAAAGAFTAAGAAGSNAKQFSGRIGRRALKPARYRALLIARDVAGNASRTSSARFRVLPKRRARL